MRGIPQKVWPDTLESNKATNGWDRRNLKGHGTEAVGVPFSTRMCWDDKTKVGTRAHDLILMGVHDPAGNGLVRRECVPQNSQVVTAHLGWTPNGSRRAPCTPNLL